MHDKSESEVRSDQMLMAGHILQAFERGGMPMHAAGYFELAAWATHELARLDPAALEQLRRGVPRALQEVIGNLLYERGDGPAAGDGARLSARRASSALLQRFRLQPPIPR